MAPEELGASSAEAEEVARARGGDEAAFEALVRRREGDIYRLCLRMLGDRDDAMDASQETFLRVYRALPHFRGEASFRTWVLGIAINVCRTRLVGRARRQGQRRVSLQRGDGEGGEEGVVDIADTAPGPEAHASAGELRAALARALAQLQPEHREVILLHQMTGLEYQAMAAVLGVRVGTVKSRMARARAALRAALEGVWP